MQGLILIQLWVFGLGLVIGSFLNVCIHRIPEGLSIVRPASKCAYCSKRIVWYDNIPVLSYLFLRGKCRHCQHKISAQYPIVEFLTGIVFLLLFRSVLMVSSGTTCAYAFFIIFCCLLIVGSFVDLRLHIIPNEITYTGLILAPIASILCVGLHDLSGSLSFYVDSGNQWIASLLASLIGILVSGGLIFLCGVFGKLVFRRDAMGFGDVKLMGVIGGFLGWKLAVATFFIAPFFGLLFGLPRLILKKGNMIPYGPFLSLAAFVCLLFKDFSIKTIDYYLNIYLSIFQLL